MKKSGVESFIGGSGARFAADHEWIVKNGFGDLFEKYLSGAGPEVLERFFGEFSQVDRKELLKHRAHVLAADSGEIKRDLKPVEVVTRQSRAQSAMDDLLVGDMALADGEIGALAFAGGSATRFKDGLSAVTGALPAAPRKLKEGLDGGAPKGCFPIGPVEGLNFFDILAGMALETGMRTGRLPAVLLMASTVTEAGIRGWLAEAGLWGLPREAITIFVQGRNPRLDKDAGLLVSRDGGLAWTGDGHGGVYSALLRGGEGSVAAALESSGVKHLVMFNIDNPAARPFIPARIGRHVRTGADFTISTVERLSADEPIGVPCFDAKNGVVEVVEYNVIDPEVAGRTDGSGRLLFSAGNINVNIVRVGAIRGDLEPTIYRNKAVMFDGEKRLTSSIEYLNQHITRKLDPRKVGFYEADRDGFFMPVKNPTGPDSAVTAFHMLSRLFSGWLEDAGATVAPGAGSEAGAYVELHPCVAMTPGDTERNGVGAGWTLGRGSRLYLCAVYAPGGETGFAGKGVTLCDKASLLVRTELPYGNLDIDLSARDVSPDPEGAGKVRIGDGVKVLEGVTVDITVLGDGECVMENGRVFDRDTTVTVMPGQRARL